MKRIVLMMLLMLSMFVLNTTASSVDTFDDVGFNIDVDVGVLDASNIISTSLQLIITDFQDVIIPVECNMIYTVSDTYPFSKDVSMSKSFIETYSSNIISNDNDISNNDVNTTQIGFKDLPLKVGWQFMISIYNKQPLSINKYDTSFTNTCLIIYSDLPLEVGWYRNCDNI